MMLENTPNDSKNASAGDVKSFNWFIGNRPLRLQISLTAGLAMIIAVVAVTLLVVKLETELLVEDLTADSEKTVSFLAAATKDAIIVEDIPLLKTIVEQIHQNDPLIHSISFLNEGGEELASFSMAPVEHEKMFVAHGIHPKTGLLTQGRDIVVAGEKFGSISISWHTGFFAHVMSSKLPLIISTVIVTLILLTACIVAAVHIFAVRPVGVINRRLLAISTETLSSTAPPPRYVASDLMVLNAAVDKLDLHVTEHHLVEKALRKSEAHLKAIFDNAPVELYLKDIEGRYIQINRQFEKLFNVKNEDLVGHFPAQAHYQELSERTRAHDLQVLETGEVVIREEDVTTELGRRVLHTIKFPVFGDQGEITGLGAVVVDVTDLKNAEKRLQVALATAKKANSAKSEFLSSMSHELRTPLNAILGFGQILEIDPVEPLSEKQKNYVKHILTGGEHLLKLVDQVLDLSKIESGKMDLSMEEITLDEASRECLTLIDRSAKTRGLKIEIDIDTPLTIKVDYIRFKQVLLNLLSNAVKYNNEGGSIALAIKDTDDNKVRISVTDTGPGIAQEWKSELFEPFNRIGRESGNIEGTGVGLTIAKQLTEAMGGQIGFESEVGKGSTFWVDFPGIKCTVVSPAKQAIISDIDERQEQSTVSAKVLYIEDIPSNLDLMEAIIKKMDGVSLISAHNAELGLIIAEERRPDLILMDISLPGMDGISAMEALSKNDSTKDIPVVAITAAAMKSDVDRGMAAGFKVYLTKPFNIPEVTKVIRTELNM